MTKITQKFNIRPNGESGMPMLLCRTVWYNHFDARTDDQFYGRHAYPNEGNIPHEIKNFLPTSNGELYGFVQVRGWGDIKIERLGARPDDDRISGVTVVWCAQHPDGRGLVVTGWYRNATVYRKPQSTPTGWAMDKADRWPFRILGHVDDSQLVSAHLRDMLVQRSGTPKAEVVFGQADLAYVEEKHPQLAAELDAYIDEQTRAAAVAVIATATGGGFGNGSVDPEENKDVELAAVAFVTKYYERDGWTVRDVSASDLGWDLECTSNGQIHLVEVKGRKAAYPAFVTLTRRERTAFERAIDDEEWAKRYHLGVVHQATAKPTLRLYRHGKQHGWKCKITAKGISTQPLGLLIQPNS